MPKSVKPNGTRLGAMCGNFKLHKQQAYRCHLFRLILSVLQTPSYNLAEFFGSSY